MNLLALKKYIYSDKNNVEKIYTKYYARSNVIFIHGDLISRVFADTEPDVLFSYSTSNF